MLMSAASRATVPSGEQFELAAQGQRAVVVEVGGGLRAYVARGREIVHGYREDELCASGRGQLLLPWPNRLQDGRYEFRGRTYQLPIDEPEHGNAIHGLVRWLEWDVGERSADRVVLEHLLHPRPGYPFSLMLRVEYSLDVDGLAVRTTATNVGREPCPFGAGAHPYLSAAPCLVDDLIVTLPARTVLHANARGLPVGRGPVEGTELDFRRSRRIGRAHVDSAFTDLDRDADGIAYVEIQDLDGDGTMLWFDKSYPFVMLFTGDLPDVNRRGLAVEPMTCPPNAFRTGDLLLTLEPGESFAGAWGITPSLAHDPRL